MPTTATLEVNACLALSVDGKLTAPTTPQQPWVKLGTPADLERLFRLRDEHEALLFGASTFRAWPGVRWGWQARQEEKQGLTGQTPPLHLLLTESWSLDWDHETFHLWEAHWPKFYVLSSNPPPPPARDCPCVVWVPLPAHADAHMVAHTINELLQTQGVRRLLIEGGGEVVAQALQARWLQRVYLTLTPWLVGGSVASLVGGAGWPLEQAPRLHWEEVRPCGDEIFLTGAVVYP